MSAVSGAPAPTTLTPPSSSHGNDPPLNFAAESNEPSLRGKESSIRSQNSRAPLVSQNGNSVASNNDIARKNTKPSEEGYLSPSYGESADPNGTASENHSPADSLLDIYGSSKAVPVEGYKPKTLENKRSAAHMYYAEDPNDPNSHWIHRDKLARIENEELQAAGIFLPRSRASSKPRHRDRSVDQTSIHRQDDDRSRSRKGSKVTDIKVADISVPSWDLRLPEEVAEDYFVSSAKNGSRIPVAKTSPLPVPQSQLDRETRLPRKRENSPNGDSIAYQKPRSRSASLKNTTPPQTGATVPAKRSFTEGSPTKKTIGTRKPSTSKGPAGRPKTRTGQKDSGGSSTGRPSTRSGDLSGMSGSKPMEGDPPWMVSAYTPDPRLPPDQQLLPTVARRLQQEKWEKEGKFGNIYDKEFRPLTDDGFGKAPEGEEKGKEEESAAGEEGEQKKKQGEWPLKEQQKASSSPQKPPPLGAYSTMPKIQDKPGMSPLPSPRSPLNQPTTHITTQQVVRMPELPAEEQKKGCGCCIVM